jgi:hypothetical protein
VFRLAWQQYGGSGLHMSFGEALDLSVQDRDWFLERIDTERSREARAIERAAKGR